MMVEEVKTRGEMVTSAAFTTQIPLIQHPTPPSSHSAFGLCCMAWWEERVNEPWRPWGQRRSGNELAMLRTIIHRPFSSHLHTHTHTHTHTTQ